VLGARNAEVRGDGTEGLLGFLQALHMARLVGGTWGPHVRAPVLSPPWQEEKKQVCLGLS
jgi:hypothetical protein